jgi:hypothetical protein
MALYVSSLSVDSAAMCSASGNAFQPTPLVGFLNDAGPWPSISVSTTRCQPSPFSVHGDRV